jgi:predicted S18 family serine protease
MRKKLAILVTMLVMLLLAAAPAFADTVTAEVAVVSATSQSAFFGFDTATAQIGGVTAEAESDFFGGTLF